MPLKKLEPKNYANFEYFRFCAFFRGFWHLTFVRGISESRHQQIWNQHKILRFFDTHIDKFQEKFFWVIIALFAILKCKCEKNGTFSNILQKVKSYFFANIYHSPCDSYWNSKKIIKLKPPTAHLVIPSPAANFLKLSCLTLLPILSRKSSEQIGRIKQKWLHFKGKVSRGCIMVYELSTLMVNLVGPVQQYT